MDVPPRLQVDAEVHHKSDISISMPSLGGACGSSTNLGWSISRAPYITDIWPWTPNHYIFDILASKARHTNIMDITATPQGAAAFGHGPLWCRQDWLLVLDFKGFGRFGENIEIYVKIEAQEQYSLIDTIIDYIFDFGPPGKCL